MLLVTYLSIQILLPLAIVLDWRDPLDKRFSWSMLSEPYYGRCKTTIENCAMDNPQTMHVHRAMGMAWEIFLYDRCWPPVVRQIAKKLCDLEATPDSVGCMNTTLVYEYLGGGTYTAMDGELILC